MKEKTNHWFEKKYFFLVVIILSFSIMDQFDDDFAPLQSSDGPSAIGLLVFIKINRFNQ